MAPLSCKKLRTKIQGSNIRGSHMIYSYHRSIMPQAGVSSIWPHTPPPSPPLDAIYLSWPAALPYTVAYFCFSVATFPKNTGKKLIRSHMYEHKPQKLNHVTYMTLIIFHLKSSAPYINSGWDVYRRNVIYFNDSKRLHSCECIHSHYISMFSPDLTVHLI